MIGGLGLIAIIAIVMVGQINKRAQADALVGLEGVQRDGSADAPVQIVEFADFGCPSCRAWHNAAVKNQLKTLYGDQIAFSFRHFPVITQQSPVAAEASQCAAEQDAFWDYHDYIYESTPQNALAVPQLKQYASDIGLDRAAFDECLDSGRYSTYVNQDLQAARAAGARGTPTFLINDQLVSASPEQMIATIDGILGR